MRTWRGSPSASPAATRMPAAREACGELAAGAAWVRGPHEVRLAVDDLEAALAQRGDQLAGAPRRPRVRASTSSEQLRSASSAPAWEISETPRSGSSSASSSPEPGPPIA